MTFSGITTTLSNSAKQINKLAQDVSTDLKNTFGPTVDKLHDGIDVLKAGSDVVSTVVKDVTGEEVTISSIQKGADDFDSKWDSFAKEVNDKFGNTTQSNQANIMETFAKSNFGNDVYNVGSAIKNEMPGVLNGIAKYREATSKSGTNSKTAEEAAKKIQAGVNNIVKATEKVAGSLNNAITICTGKGLPVLSTLSKIGGSAAVANLNKALNLGVAGATTATAANQLKESLKRKDLRGVTDAMAKGANSINDVLSQVQALCPNFPNAQIPVQITNSIRLLKNGQSIYDAAGNMLTALVVDASGHVTPGSILNLASNFNKNWDTFSSTIDALFQVTPGNGQQAVLETVAKTMFGTNVFNAGSVIKRQLPGVLSGINGVQDALKQFGGSYRDPIAAATKIKKGVEKIIQSVEKISRSLGGMVKTYQGGQGNTLLNTLGNISGTKGIKTLDTALRIGGGATAIASNAGALAQAIKNNDLKGAIAAAKQAFSDIKTLTKKGQYKDQSSSDNSASTPTGTAAQSKTANSNSSNDPQSNKQANKNAAAKTDSYVCSGATLRCTKGTSQAKLTVLPSRTVYLTGQPMANISDHLSMFNLSPFGRCRSMGFPATASATAAHHGHLTPMPCMHNTPLPWMGGKNDYIVKGDPALLKSSTCSCLWGGTISIVDDGQHGEGTQWINKKASDNFEIQQDYNKGPNADSVLDGIQLALDAAGFVPGLGAIPDLANAAISALRGNWAEAGLSVLAAVPIIGDAAAGVRIAGKGLKIAKQMDKSANDLVKVTRGLNKYEKKAVLAKEASKYTSKNITEKELIAHGMSQDDAKFFMKEVKSERRNDAFNFYKEYTGWDAMDIENHISMIDFDKPVIRDVVPPKGQKSITLYQFKGLSQSGKKYKTGQYYTSNPNATPTDLGISERYGSRELRREKFSITIENPRPVLRSTARTGKDTWSIEGKAIPTKGGAEQIFIPFKKWLLK